MAKIKEMLGEREISGFRGTLDFYYYMGIPCVRRWPSSPGHLRSPAVQRGWTPFSDAVRLWRSTPLEVKKSFQSMSSATGLTDRDLFTRAYIAGIPRLYDLTVPAIPSPAEGYWAITKYWKEDLGDRFVVYVETDVPCHLWLCWTTVPPDKHIAPVYRRGIWMHADPRFCFVAYNCIEEQDAGDHIGHQFNFPPWPVCETRYFTFHGTINGVQSPSTSALFDLHFGTIQFQCEGGGSYSIPANSNEIPWAVFICQKTGALEHVRLRLGRNGEPGDARLTLFKANRDNLPSSWQLAQATREITGMPEYPFLKWFTFQFDPIPIFEGTWYTFRLTCDAVKPVQVRWPGSVLDPCPQSYAAYQELIPPLMIDYPNNDLYLTLRGQEIAF